MSTVITLGKNIAPEKTFETTLEERAAMRSAVRDVFKLQVKLGPLAMAQWDAVRESPAGQQVGKELLELLGLGSSKTNSFDLWVQGKLSDKQFGALFYSINEAFNKWAEYAADPRLEPVVREIMGAAQAEWGNAIAPLAATGHIKEPGIPYGLLIAGIVGLGVAGFVLWKQD